MQYYFDHPWFFLAYAVLLLGSILGGSALAHFQFTRKQRDWRPTGLESAIIGLFGLMLSFSFLAAHSATRDRNRLVHVHADAIASMRRTSLLMAPALKEDTRSFLLGHLDGLLSGGPTGFQRKENIHDHMEDLFGVYVGQLQSHASDSLLRPDIERLMQELNVLSAAYYRSHYGHEERLPKLIIELLLFSAMLIGMLVGFVNGLGGIQLRQMLTSILFALIALLTIRTVLDMNNPYGGGIRPELENLEQLRDAMHASQR